MMKFDRPEWEETFDWWGFYATIDHVIEMSDNLTPQEIEAWQKSER